VCCECTKRAQQLGLGIGVQQQQQQQQQRDTNSSNGSCHSRQRCAHHAPRSTKSPLKTNALVGEGLPTISSLQAIQAGRQQVQGAMQSGSRALLAARICSCLAATNQQATSSARSSMPPLTFCRRRGTVRVCRPPR
jgi:hypothetical protein